MLINVLQTKYILIKNGDSKILFDNSASFPKVAYKKNFPTAHQSVRPAVARSGVVVLPQADLAAAVASNASENNHPSLDNYK